MMTGLRGSGHRGLRDERHVAPLHPTSPEQQQEHHKEEEADRNGHTDADACASGQACAATATKCIS